MSLFSRIWRPLLGRTRKPFIFTNEGFVTISADQKVKEEILPDYVASRFYPHGISGTYRVSRHVALKLFIDSNSIGSGQETELDMYKRIEKSSKDHPGRDAVRSRKWTAGITSVSCPPFA
ncbi:hypothetical protein IAQ61_010258 [Plenodomus lingam]|uniref:uncharacterized protein n=1 Tax=Leptosphaeria maculans TaxID=5022 RepID=UPI003320BF34|nr:hypothetical protein IAQ61_010258 [Plenodomus lingam]